uniref:Btz domain-containing protein n=1 Tax=Onchocerca volvulus TaxID=6282 RepID=A0A8R1TRP0_ONCVO
MGSKGRSSGVSKSERSGRSLGNGSSSRQERLHHRKNSYRSRTPRKTTVSSSSRVVPSKKVIRRSPPLRKSKPSPVNELDILALSQKEQQSKTGNRGKDGIQNRSERMQHRQFAGTMDRRGLWGSRNSGFGMRQGMDYRRTPMYPLRRGIGGGDLVDQRAQYGRNGRQSYRRSSEQSKSTNNEEKPVMNLFDPCKVPTGRFYFTHDDRTTKPVRTSRSRYSISGDTGWQSLPVGWRNVRKVRRSDDVLHDDNHSSFHKKRSEKNPTDEVWKHDMFECEEGEAVQVTHVRDQS